MVEAGIQRAGEAHPELPPLVFHRRGLRLAGRRNHRDAGTVGRGRHTRREASRKRPFRARRKIAGLHRRRCEVVHHLVNHRHKALEGGKIAVTAVERHGGHEDEPLAELPLHQPGLARLHAPADPDRRGRILQSEFPIGGNKAEPDIRLVRLRNQPHRRMREGLEVQQQGIGGKEPLLHAGRRDGLAGEALPCVVELRLRAVSGHQQQPAARLDKRRQAIRLGRRQAGHVGQQDHPIGVQVPDGGDVGRLHDGGLHKVGHVAGARKRFGPGLARRQGHPDQAGGLEEEETLRRGALDKQHREPIHDMDDLLHGVVRRQIVFRLQPGADHMVARGLEVMREVERLGSLRRQVLEDRSPFHQRAVHHPFQGRRAHGRRAGVGDGDIRLDGAVGADHRPRQADIGDEGIAERSGRLDTAAEDARRRRQGLERCGEEFPARGRLGVPALRLAVGKDHHALGDVRPVRQQRGGQVQRFQDRHDAAGRPALRRAQGAQQFTPVRGRAAHQGLRDRAAEDNRQGVRGP